jgi:DNA-binding transcriptional regulator YiaG
MALPIKQVPILSGKAAEEFERRADEALKKPRRRLTPEEIAEIREVERLMREYVPSWEREK